MRKIAFVLAATDFGPLIINRMDYSVTAPNSAFGMGAILLETGTCDPEEAELYRQIMQLRRRYHGDGVHFVDCGANVGTFTVELAKMTDNWGTVTAIEAQERIFYALAGNIALGNHHNAKAILAVVGNHVGTQRIPVLDYESFGSFGSLELIESSENNDADVGQVVDYSFESTVEVKAITIDSLNISRLDLLKIDVERMELDVLEGAKSTIERLHPIIAVEHIKTGCETIMGWLQLRGYPKIIRSGHMLVAIHPDDPVIEHLIEPDIS